MGAIAGKVMNQRDMRGIEGATILATEGGSDREVTSQAKGSFLIDNLSAGNYDLTVSKPDFLDGLYGPIVVLEDMTTELSLALEPKPL